MITLTGGAEYPRNHYFSLHWNTYSIGETNYRCYNYNEFPDRKIVQRLSDGYIDVSFYATNFIKSSPQQLGIFMKTFLFYVQLMLKDKDITRIGYVYLLKFKTYFKIGKTINFEKRYDVSTKKNLISIIPVSNHDEVEKVLIKAYKNKNYKLYKGNEYFIYDNFNDVEQIFNDVVLPYKSVYDHRSSNLIHFTKLSNGKLKSWIHPTLCEIFNNKYAKSENERLKLNNCTELISKQISNG